MPKAPLTAAQRSTRARAAAYALHAKRDPRETTERARSAFLKRFEPNDPNLTPEERERRTQAALRAHMAKLALRSSRARSRDGSGAA